ncbi:MAG TPA: heparan-alpha-glucosaminide N-acetyltransferase domain-containing protein [Acidimicrobiales bacterium]|nr:heparan-alpha-glucosaminide N-acetyltransferase domain-containing protein [Acidimicrobiales bacterium]
MLVTRAPERLRRLTSLDVLRGATVALMIVVENQGSGEHPFPGAGHAAWNGFTPADLVFPLFLFVMGASLAQSVDRLTWARALRRTAVLFFLGLVLNGLGRVPLDSLKFLGVLQRIALCYLLTVAVVKLLPPRRQWQVGAGVLLAWWAFLSLGPLTPEGNMSGWLDRLLLGTERLYGDGSYDPSGLASTPAAAVNVLAGFWIVQWLRQEGRGFVARVGVFCVGSGLLWAIVYPVNKRLWTSSFVVLTVGLSALALVAVGERHRFAWAFEVFGRNAIVLYVASELVSDVLKDTGARDWLYHHLFVPWAGLHVGSLAYALAFVGLWWLVLYGMWRRRWFVSV